MNKQLPNTRSKGGRPKGSPNKVTKEVREMVVAALDRAGYISCTPNDGRTERLMTLTDRGRKALEMAQ